MKMRYIYAIYLKNFETDINFSKVAKFLNRYLIVVMFIDCSNLNKQKIEVTSEHGCRYQGLIATLIFKPERSKSTE